MQTLSNSRLWRLPPKTIVLSEKQRPSSRIAPILSRRGKNSKMLDILSQKHRLNISQKTISKSRMKIMRSKSTKCSKNSMTMKMWKSSGTMPISQIRSGTKQKKKSRRASFERRRFYLLLLFCFFFGEFCDSFGQDFRIKIATVW